MPATLSPGCRVDEYEILAPIGRGGMGEVYKARDTRVDRIVAIKLLPGGVSDQADARDRFHREARALATLSHPRVCSLFEFTRHEGRAVLVMEYVDGESLAERLAHGRLALPEALQRAIEVAEGLAAAHHAGIVHRDFKPANIMLAKDGAKLLDFGLAKAVTQPLAGNDPTQAVPHDVTQAGGVVGTPAYMAPEQLQGRIADVRSDIWAFGCVLYEMLTGAPVAAHARGLDANGGRNDLRTALDGSPVTVALDRVIRKCLAQEPDARWQSATDLRDTLSWIARDAEHEGDAVPQRSSRRVMWAALALGAVGLAAALAVFKGTGTSGAPGDVTLRHVELTVPRLSALEGVALSPDGTSLAFIGPGPDGIPVVWVRPFASAIARPLPGTERADAACPPFWAPGGQAVAFVAENKLRRIAITGGQAQSIADFSGSIFGGDWGADGTIVLGTYQLSRTYGIHRVPADGGQLAPVLLMQPGTLLQAQPRFLGDGRRFLYLSWAADESGRQICLGSLDDPNPKCPGIPAHFFAGMTRDHLLFARGDTLYMQRFDSRTGRPEGAAVVVSEGLARDDLGRVSASIAGETLLYQVAQPEWRQLVWMTRDGVRAGTVGDAAVQAGVRMSEGGEWIAVERPGERGPAIWTIEVERGITSRVPTPDLESAWSPVLSGDGGRLTYQAPLDGHAAIVEQPTHGGERRVLFRYGGDGILAFADRSRDGELLAIGLAERNRRVIQVVRASGGPPATVADGPVSLVKSRFSPNGRWIAYESGQTGQTQVFVAPVPPTGQRWQVSSAGGDQPEWRADGQEIFYLAPDGALMAAAVETAPAFALKAPRLLFRTPLRGQAVEQRYAVTRNGERFLFSVPREGDQTSTTTTFRVLLNWRHAPGR